MDRLRLTKLAFLFRQEAKPTGFYGFLPYKFGPYSFQMFREIDRLTEWSYVALDKTDIVLSEIGEEASRSLKNQTATDVNLVHERYSTMNTNALMDHVYRTNPWFALNSERRNRPCVKRPLGECATYTCGYEGLRVDDFLDLLLRSGIRRIIDVRNNPVSMQYGFHKRTLCSLAGNVGIQYGHFPDLGIPSHLRRNLDTQSDYEKLFLKYITEIVEPARVSMEKVALAMKDEPSVLICMEADPIMCHRTSLANEMSRISGLPVRDLRDERAQEN